MFSKLQEELSRACRHECDDVTHLRSLAEQAANALYDVEQYVTTIEKHLSALETAIESIFKTAEEAMVNVETIRDDLGDLQ